MAMRDLNLGPDSREIVQRFRKANSITHEERVKYLNDMAAMLERWMELCWCWPDAAPAQICGGPHVKVFYAIGKPSDGHEPVEHIEHVNHVGEMFPGTPYTIVKGGK